MKGSCLIFRWMWCLFLEAFHLQGIMGCLCWCKLVGECSTETKNVCRHACLDVLRFWTLVDTTAQFWLSVVGFTTQHMQWVMSHSIYTYSATVLKGQNIIYFQYVLFSKLRVCTGFHCVQLCGARCAVSRWKNCQALTYVMYQWNIIVGSKAFWMHWRQVRNGSVV